MNDRDLKALVEDAAERFSGDPEDQDHLEDTAFRVTEFVLEELGVPSYPDASEASAEVLLFEEKVFEMALNALEDLQKRDGEDD